MKKDLKLQHDVEMTDKNDEQLKADAGQKKRELNLQRKVKSLGYVKYQWNDKTKPNEELESVLKPLKTTGDDGITRNKYTYL